MVERSVDRLLLDVSSDGTVSLQEWPTGEFPSPVGHVAPLTWPLRRADLEELRWYLEDYLEAPFGVYEERGLQTAGQLREWGERIFDVAFSVGPRRDAWVRCRARAEAVAGRSVEVLVRSASAEYLSLPWELLTDPGRPGPAALEGVSITRSLPATDLRQVFGVGGEHLRVLMVIARPRGTEDVGYRVIARPLLKRLEAVRGRVELVVLRPPTLENLRTVLGEAQAGGKPFQVVHFDGHGAFGDVSAAEGSGSDGSLGGSPQGILVFERPGGGTDLVPADQVARVLADACVPVVVLNACQSAVVGSRVEAAVATRLLQEGTAAVVAMAFSVYTVAAAEFMTAFYESLFAGERMADAVTQGRRRLARRNDRPSPKGGMPLADWMVPVLYARSDVTFPGLRTEREPQVPIEDLLDRMRRPAEVGARKVNTNCVPASEDEFVGRDVPMFLLEVAAQLQRVVVLHGPGGIGKTELAKAFGLWYSETGAIDHPDWVIWHSFEPGVASFGLDGVIDGIGLQVFGDRFAELDRTDRRSAVEQLLASQRLLLIWDNFEPVFFMPDPSHQTPLLSEEEREELRQFLLRIATGRKSAVVITSRTREDWLGDDLTVGRVQVNGLDREESNEYADQLLAPFPDMREQRKTREFSELMQWLDGHPLSMRLVIPHLRNTAARDLLASLRGVAPPQESDTGNEGRTGSLTACIDYSFTHLSPEDQEALTIVSLVQGVVDVDVLKIFSDSPGVPQRYRGRTQEDWDGTMKRGVAVGLLTVMGQGMYGIHPALHSYLRYHHSVAGVAAASGSSPVTEASSAEYEAAQVALLNAYAVFSEWLSYRIRQGDAALALRLVDKQRRALGAMLDFALVHKMWQQAHAIVRPLTEYWDSRGLMEEARIWTDRALDGLAAADGTAPAPNSQADFLWNRLTTYQENRKLRTGRIDQAETSYRRIFDSLNRKDVSPEQRLNVAVVMNQLGRVAQERGELTQAEDWYLKSLQIKESLGDDFGVANTCQNLGVLTQMRGDLARAEKWYRKSLTIRKRLDDRPGVAAMYHHLGGIALKRGQLDQAEHWILKALATNEEIGDQGRIAASHHQIGNLALERGLLEKAERAFRKALTIHERLRNPSGLGGIYNQLGTVAIHREKLEQAEQWYLKAIAIKKPLGERPDLGNSYQNLGVVYHLQGQSDQAVEWILKSLRIAEKYDHAQNMISSYEALRMIAEDQGKDEEALMWTIRCFTVLEQILQPGAVPANGHLKRLAKKLGVDMLTRTWREVADGDPPPQVLEACD